MTIDDRLEKLTARHEALTGTVEILTRDMVDLQRAVKDTQKFVTEVAEASARLLHIAQIHENRITRLEGDAD